MQQQQQGPFPRQSHTEAGPDPHRAAHLASRGAACSRVGVGPCPGDQTCLVGVALQGSPCVCQQRAAAAAAEAEGWVNRGQQKQYVCKHGSRGTRAAGRQPGLATAGSATCAAAAAMCAQRCCAAAMCCALCCVRAPADGSCPAAVLSSCEAATQHTQTRTNNCCSYTVLLCRATLLHRSTHTPAFPSSSRLPPLPPPPAPATHGLIPIWGGMPGGIMPGGGGAPIKCGGGPPPEGGPDPGGPMYGGL